MARPITNLSKRAVYRRNWMRAFRAKTPKKTRALSMTQHAVYQRSHIWRVRNQPRLWAAWDAVKEYGGKDQFLGTE